MARCSPTPPAPSCTRRVTPSYRWTPRVRATPSTPPTSTRSCVVSTRRSAYAVPAWPARSPPRPSAAPPRSRPSTSSPHQEGAPMSHVSTEIEAQPAAWRQALDLLPSIGDALPAPGERVAVIGCGTSWFMAEAYAALREDAGAGETDFFPASRMPTARTYDRVVA